MLIPNLLLISLLFMLGIINSSFKVNYFLMATSTVQPGQVNLPCSWHSPEIGETLKGAFVGGRGADSSCTILSKYLCSLSLSCLNCKMGFYMQKVDEWTGVVMVKPYSVCTVLCIITIKYTEDQWARQMASVLICTQMIRQQWWAFSKLQMTSLRFQKFHLFLKHSLNL